MKRTILVAVATIGALAMAANVEAQRSTHTSQPSQLDALKQERRALEDDLAEFTERGNADEMEKIRLELARNAALIKALTPRVAVFSLRHAQASEAADLLDAISTDGTRIAIDKRTNRLLVSAPEDKMAALSALLEQIDKPADQGSFRSQFQANDSAAALLMETLKNENVSARYSNGHFTIEATSSADIARIQSLYKEIEAKTKPVARTIRIVWLMDSQEEKNVPVQLRPVIDELEKIGVADMSVAAQTVVRSLNEFTLVCSPPGGFRLIADGKFTKEKLSIDLQVNSTGEPAKEIVAISTEIDVPMGHPVVLGVSPTDSVNSAFVIVVE